MELDRFLNLLASLFGALGSLYTLKSILGLTPNVMERLSRTYFSFSIPQINALASQKADSVVGVILIVIALLLALVNIAVAPSGIRPFEKRDVALAVSVALVAIVYIALIPIRDGYYKQQRLEIGRIIVGEFVDGLINKKRLDSSEAPSLPVYARDLLALEVAPGDSPRLVLERLASAVGRELPQDFDFSDVEKP
jgi:hypothetical protein